MKITAITLHRLRLQLEDGEFFLGEILTMGSLLRSKQPKPCP